MKKTLKYLLVICLLVCTFAVIASATKYSGYCGSNVTWSLDTSTGVLEISGTGAMKDCSSASYVPWYSYRSYVKTVKIGDSVTSIGDEAFNDCRSLTSVTIGDSVTIIGDYAFSGCSSLTSITIPDSVTSIGNYVFQNCSGITSVTIPDSVTIIGDYAFRSCSSLTSVTIGDSVTIIGYSAFYCCISITSLTIPDSVTSIGSSAFYGCTKLQNTVGELIYIKANDNPYFCLSDTTSTSITSCAINEDTKFIGGAAFYDCSSLTSITIPDGVTSIGKSAFNGCSSLKSVTIGDSVTSIGDNAFHGCSGLTSITIPDSVTSIGTDAFSGRSSLTSITLPFVGGSATGDRYLGYIFGASSYDKNFTYVPSSLKTVIISDKCTSIGTWAFYGCTGLTSITIGDSVTSIGYYAFEGCSGLTSVTIPDSVTSIGDGAFYDCTGLTSVTIGDSVKSIGISAFSGCKGLTSITIPDSVTSIGSSAFYGCTKLENTVGDLVYIKTTENPHFYLLDTTSTSITICTINEDTKFIGSLAFYDCSSITSITIPDSVTSIGDAAFNSCSSLTRITIPDSVTSIGDAAFCGCGNLTSITIPDSVTSIGYEAFYGCSSLTRITIPDSVTSIGDEAFYGCSSLTSVTIGDSVTSIGDEAFYGCSSLTSITIPDSVTIIGYEAFYGCSSLATIKLPFVGRSATENQYLGYIFGAWGYDQNFEYVPSSLKTVIISDKCTSIGDNAFYGCTSITSVTIGDSVTSIGDYAFYSCSKLTSVTIPDSVTSIGDEAFYGCSSLTSVTIGESVTSIGDEAFTGCSNLTSVTIPDSVTSIGKFAFSACSGLASVTISDSVTSIGYGAFYNCNSLASIKLPFVGGSATENQYLGYIFGASSYDENSIDVPSSLKTVIISDKCTSIGDNAFYGCTGITSVTIGKGVTSIGDNAFHGCSGLTSITIPDSVTSIGDYAFYGCSSLTSCDFLGKAPTLGTSVFPSTILLSYTGKDSGFTSPKWNGYDCFTNDPPVVDELKQLTKNASGIYTNAQGIVFTLNTATGFATVGDLSGAGNNSTFCGVGGRAVVIPEAVYDENGKSYKVTQIAANAFSNNKYITSVSLPNTLFSIGAGAFSGCGNITKFTVESGGTNMFTADSYGVLYNVRALLYYPAASAHTEYTIPATTTKINGGAFYGTKNLEKLSLPFVGETPASVGKFEFITGSTTTSIKHVVLLEGITTIGEEAFYGFNTIKAITVPKSLTSVEKEAFYNCSSLNAVYITDLAAWCKISFTYSEYWDDDDLIYRVRECSNPLYYAKNLYLNNNKITDLEIPSGVTTVKDYTFISGNFKTVVIPDSVTHIGEGVFKLCNNITELTLPFADSRMTEYQRLEYLFMAQGKFGPDNSEVPRSLKKVVLSDACTKIEATFFSNCKYIEEIVCGKNVSSIEAGAFKWCDSLESFDIPVKVTAIPDELFYYCYSLKNVGVHENVTRVGAFAFYGCASLAEFNMPNGFKNIGSSAFYGCTSLKEIVIPSSVTGIGEKSFYICTGLTNLVINNSTARINNYAFGGCTSLVSADIGNATPSIGEYAFSGCNKLEEITFASSTSAIGKYAFDGCAKLKKVTFADGLSTIGEYAFVNTAITDLIIPSSVTVIEGYAFNSCEYLTTLKVDGAAVGIGERAFYECPSLKSVVFDNAAAKIGNYAFCEDSAIETLDLGNAVTNIYGNAFRDCDKIAIVTIPDSVKTIGSRAFYDCNALKDIIIGKGVTSISSGAFGENLALERIVVDDSNTEYASDEHGVLFEKDTQTLMVYPSARLWQFYEIPETVTRIDSDAFNVCPNLVSLLIPASVTSMSNALDGCLQTALNVYSNTAGEKYAINNGDDYSGTYYVIDNAVLMGIYVRSTPYAEEFVLGSEFDFDGLCICGFYDNGATVEFTEYTLVYDETKLGEQTVTVKYGTLTTTFDIKIVEPKEVGIRLVRLPDKTAYIEGNEFSLAGMVVNLVYNNGYEKEVTDYAVTTPDMNKVGTQTLTVTYGGFTQTFDITVKEKSITKIEITSEPSKTVYLIGESLNKSGLAVVVYYDNGTSEKVTDYEISGFNSAKAGACTVTVKYGNFSDTFVVTINKHGGVAAPSTPVLKNLYANTAEIVAMSGCEYSIDGGETWQTSNVFEALTPNTEYNICARYAETETHLAGAVSGNLTIKTKYLLSGFVSFKGIFAVGEKQTADISHVVPADATFTYSWQRDGVDIPGATSDTYYIQAADIGCKITVTITAYGDYYGTLTSKRLVKAPEQAAADVIGSDYVKLVKVDGCEYSKDGGKTWQTSNVFEGLDANTEYFFCIRYAETDDSFASDASELLSVTTLTVRPTSVSVVATSTSIPAGGNCKVSATVLPANATFKDVVWSSSNENVVTVDEDGNVTAVGAGKATVTATTVDGGIKASCTITVTRAITGIEVVGDSAVAAGKTVTLKANTYCYENGKKVSVKGNVIWTSSNENIATVSGGKVKGIAAGTATITATVEGTDISASVEITVAVPVTKLKFDSTKVTTYVGNELDLGALLTYSPEDNTDTLVWTSAKESVATVDENGVVTAHSMGSAKITVKSLAGGKSASCTVTVAREPEGITLTPVEAVAVGKSVSLKANAYYMDGTKAVKTKDTISWTSSDESVVTITKGKLKGVGAGTATVTAYVEGTDLSESFEISVVVPVKTLKLSTTKATAYVGNEIDLGNSLTIAPAENTDVIVWSSSDEDIATVDENGLVSIHAMGKVKITALAVAGNKKATCTITVTKEPEGITLTPVEAVAVGKSVTLKANAYYMNGAKVVKTKDTISWSSSDESVVTITKGKLKGVGAGTATVTAYVEGTDISETFEISVVVPAKTVKLAFTKLNASVGDTVNLGDALIVSPIDNTDIIVWTSSDESVATVDENGVVTIHKVGKAKITVKAVGGGKSAYCTITVK